LKEAKRTVYHSVWQTLFTPHCLGGSTR